MRCISENDLSVVIVLLAAKIRMIKQDVAQREPRADRLSDEEFDRLTDDRDLLASYQGTMDNLREEYMAALADGVVLPDFETLISSP